MSGVEVLRSSFVNAIIDLRFRDRVTHSQAHTVKLKSYKYCSDFTRIYALAICAFKRIVIVLLNHFKPDFPKIVLRVLSALVPSRQSLSSINHDS